MDADRSLEVAKAKAVRMTVAGFTLAILGLFAVASPLAAGISIAILAGAAVTAGGLAQAIFALQGESGGRKILSLIMGVLALICGALMIGHPLLGLGFMTLLLVAFFWVSGVSEIVYAFQVRPTKGWLTVIISGILSLLLGILIWRQWPLSGAWAVGVLVGVKLLAYGVALAVLGIAALTMVHEEKESGGYTPLA